MIALNYGYPLATVAFIFFFIFFDKLTKLIWEKLGQLYG